MCSSSMNHQRFPRFVVSFEAVARLGFNSTVGFLVAAPVLSCFFIAQGKLPEAFFAPSFVNKLESTRHRQASNTFRAAQILRRGLPKSILQSFFFLPLLRIYVVWKVPLALPSVCSLLYVFHVLVGEFWHNPISRFSAELVCAEHHVFMRIESRLVNCCSREASLHIGLENDFPLATMNIFKIHQEIMRRLAKFRRCALVLVHAAPRASTTAEAGSLLVTGEKIKLCVFRLHKSQRLAGEHRPRSTDDRIGLERDHRV